MAIWSSDPFFEEDLSDASFWTVRAALTFAGENVMSWISPRGYTFVLRGTGFAFIDGMPVHGTTADLEIYQGDTLMVTVTAIDRPVSALFADNMAQFFGIMFTEVSRTPQAA